MTDVFYLLMLTKLYHILTKHSTLKSTFRVQKLKNHLVKLSQLHDHMRKKEVLPGNYELLIEKMKLIVHMSGPIF